MNLHEEERITEVPHGSFSSYSKNVNVRISALEKLVDHAASGIGSVAGYKLSPWLARQDAKALAIQAQGWAEVLLLEAEAMSESRSLLQTPEISIQGELDIQERVAQRLHFQEEKRQRNIQDVVFQTAGVMGDKTVPDQETDHDFASRFFGDVQDVSSAEMRTLYSKVLAGQIERPGSFSLLALKVLKYMNLTTAKLFQTLCSACISLMPDGKTFMDIRVPVLNGSAGNNALSQYGLSFDQLNVLSEQGLVISDYSSRSRNYQLCIGQMLSKREMVKMPFSFQGQFWVLEPINGREIGTEFELSGVSLTRAGGELSRIVEIAPMEKFAQELKESFASHNLRMAPAGASLQSTTVQKTT